MLHKSLCAVRRCCIGLLRYEGVWQQCTWFFTGESFARIAQRSNWRGRQRLKPLTYEPSSAPGIPRGEATPSARSHAQPSDAHSKHHTHRHSSFACNLRPEMPVS
ncbi:hypothetical protein L1887_52924 [Cichorium endivia]|nr:hypothetical protein L1887_52924 [Cichorium endivia]